MADATCINRTPVDVQQDMMARLAYHIYRLPRHQRAEDSWPMDVIIMLDEYFHLGDSMSTNEDASYHDDEQHYDNDSANTADWNDVALTPAQRWLKFLIVIQCSLGEYVDSTVALQPVADSIGPSFSALQSFRRALLREEPRVNDVLSLYDTFTSRYLHHRIRTDALHKSHSHLLTPMPPTMKLITRKDYFRLLELMHWQLDEEEFCSRVQGVNSDMALFGIAPNLIKQDGFDVEECERWWTMMVDELTRR